MAIAQKKMPTAAAMLQGELDEAMIALTTFDAARLEAVEQRIRMMTAARLRNARESLPQIVEKHALLGQLLAATAANLKVLVSVMHLETRMETR
jgi:hypothetical protein